MASSIRGFPKSARRSADLQAFAERIAPLPSASSSASRDAASVEEIDGEGGLNVDESESGHGKSQRGVVGVAPMLGGRHFWLSDYTAYHAESHFSSLKMYSTRMTNNEICNNENLKADHTADGTL